MSCHNRIFHFICLYKPNVTTPIKSQFFAVNIENLMFKIKAGIPNIYRLKPQRWSWSWYQLQTLNYCGLVGLEHQKQMWGFHGTANYWQKVIFLAC